MSIHKRIKERRLDLGLTMKDLAKESGVSSWQTIQQWEQEDGTAPKRSRLEKVASALKTTPEYLLTGEADASHPAWPLGPLTPERYEQLPDLVKGRIVERALVIVEEWEASARKSTTKDETAAA